MSDVLSDAAALIRDGQKIEAQKLLRPFIKANPRNITAWLLALDTLQTPAEKRNSKRFRAPHKQKTSPRRAKFLVLSTTPSSDCLLLPSPYLTSSLFQSLEILHLQPN